MKQEFFSKYLFICCFLRLYLQHMAVPRIGFELELQLLAYTTATETQDPSHICELHHSSLKCQMLYPIDGGQG